MTERCVRTAVSGRKWMVEIGGYGRGVGGGWRVHAGGGGWREWRGNENNLF